jgi:hypothetical protein
MSGTHTSASEEFERGTWENKSARIVHGTEALPPLPMPAVSSSYFLALNSSGF